MVKERSPIMVILFTMLTCGIYGIYWLYDTSRELNEKGHLPETPGKMLMFMLLGSVTCLITYYLALWKYSKAIESLTKGEKSGGLMFALAMFFPIGFFYIAQTELNKIATPAQN